MGTKNVVLFLGFVASLVFSQTLRAGEPTSVTLQLPDGFIEKLCSKPLWENMTVVWKGVEDKRPSPEIGSQEKKGKILDELVSDPPLAKLLDPLLRQLFTQCGMKLLDHGDEEATRLGVEISEFHAGVEKRLITGKGEAKSRLVITKEASTQTRMTEVGYEMESKQIRHKSTKQLTETLNELLRKTLAEIPTSVTVRALAP